VIRILLSFGRLILVRARPFLGVGARPVLDVGWGWARLGLELVRACPGKILLVRATSAQERWEGSELVVVGVWVGEGSTDAESARRTCCCNSVAIEVSVGLVQPSTHLSIAFAIVAMSL
jgi:hypothetical protein